MHQVQRWLFAAMVCFGGALHSAHAAVEYKIVTASERGTYIQIGRDLARFVAPEADIALDVLPSRGSADNLNRLRYEANVKFAIVQSDVYQAFLDFASTGNAEAARLIRPLRVVAPLYDEEIYFIVRADSPLQYVHEIRDKRINADRLQSGTALSATTLYRLMFGQPMSEGNVSFLSNEEALVKLTTDRTLDVVIIVAGQPAKILADMKPEAKQLVKLLKVDLAQPSTKAALQTYFPATIRSASYPNWLDQDVQGLSVKALLVTYDYAYKPTTEHMAGFARSLCRNLPILQTEGHPKWRDVEWTLPDLGAGWEYYAPIARILRECHGGQPKPASTVVPERPAHACTQSERILGLCTGP